MNTFDPFSGFPTTPRERQRPLLSRLVRWSVQMLLFCLLTVTVFLFFAFPLFFLVVGILETSFLYLFIFFLILYGEYRFIKWGYRRGREAYAKSLLKGGD